MQLSSDAYVSKDTGRPRGGSATDKRTLRIFLSSTFRDMQEERNEINRSALPRLRRECARRGIFLSFIDLRWVGASPAPSRAPPRPAAPARGDGGSAGDHGGGGRYGWHLPPGKEDPLLATALENAAGEYPFVRAHRDNSVTELEIRLGSLLRPEEARGGASSTSPAPIWWRPTPRVGSPRGPTPCAPRPTKPRPWPRPAPAEPAEPVATAPQAARLEALKREVAAAGMPTRGYDSPAALAEALHDDLLRLLERDYPVGAGLSWAEERRLEHFAEGEMLRRAFVGREGPLAALRGYAAGASPAPLALLGAEGLGKSALLAQFAGQWRAQHPDELVVEHYVAGAAEGGTAIVGLFRRVREEAAAWRGEPDASLEEEEARGGWDDDAAVCGRFADWLQASRGALPRRLLLLVDGVDRFGGAEARRLVWLPGDAASGRLRVVVSLTADSAAAKDEALRAKLEPFSRLELGPLGSGEVAAMVEADLALAGKGMAAPRMARIAGAAQCGSPLFLSVLLAEVKADAVFDTLDAKLDGLLACAGTPGALRLALRRLERQYGGPARALLAALAASRFGLAEAEARELSGAPPLAFAELSGALAPYTVNRFGLLDFFNAGMRAAVEEGLELRGERRAAEHRRLADYFAAQPPSDRRWVELPYQLLAAGEAERLRAALLDPDILVHRLGTHPAVREAARLWRFAAGGDLRRAGAELEAAARRIDADASLPAGVRALACQSASHVCRTLGLFRPALGCMIPALERAPEAFAAGSSPLANITQNAGALLHAAGNAAAAAETLAQALAMWRLPAPAAEGRARPRELEAASAASDLGAVLAGFGRAKEAEGLLREALATRGRLLGAGHPLTVETTNALALSLKHQGRLQEALAALESGIAAAGAVGGTARPSSPPRQPLRRPRRGPRPGPALAAAERAAGIAAGSLGEQHPTTLHSRHAVAGALAAAGRLQEARAQYEAVLAGFRAALSPTHHGTVGALHGLGAVLARAGDPRGAAALQAEALAAAEAGPMGRDHPPPAPPPSPSGALPVLMRAAADGERLAPESGETAEALSALAGCLASRGDPEGALPLLERATEIHRARRGPLAPEARNTTVGLAGLLAAAGRAGEAETLLRERLAEAQGIAAPHAAPAAADYAKLLAHMLRRQGRAADARAVEDGLASAAAELRRARGPGDPAAFAATEAAASTARAGGRGEEADALLWGAVAEAEAEPAGPGREGPPPALLYLGALLGPMQAARRHAEAAAVLRRVAAAVEGRAGPSTRASRDPSPSWRWRRRRRAGGGRPGGRRARRRASPAGGARAGEPPGAREKAAAALLAAYRAAGRGEADARAALAHRGLAAP
eukprot:tig00020807_g14073.t1